MSVVESIISMIPGIGPIIGPLLGGILGGPNAVKKRVSFRMSSSPEDLVDIALSEDGTKIMLYNQSSGQVGVSFPSQNGYEGEAVTIPRANQADLTTSIINCTTNDVDNIDISLLPPGSKHDANAPNMIGLSSSGVVPVDGSAKILGSYIRVTCKLTEDGQGRLTVEIPRSYKLVRVNSIYVESSEGSMRYEANNCIPGVSGVVTQSIPGSTLATDTVIISLTCSVQELYGDKFLAENNRKFSIQPISEKEKNRLQSLEQVLR